MGHGNRSVEIRPNGAPLGAEIHGLDANQSLPAELLLQLKQAQRDHHILIFKRQDLDEDAFKTLATSFGPIFQNPTDVPVLASADAGGVAPEIVRVSNVDGYTGTGELSPHADHQWTPYPSAGSSLYALEVPASGGDTTYDRRLRLQPRCRAPVRALGSRA